MSVEAKPFFSSPGGFGFFSMLPEFLHYWKSHFSSLSLLLGKDPSGTDTQRTHTPRWKAVQEILLLMLLKRGFSPLKLNIWAGGDAPNTQNYFSSLSSRT